MWNWAESAALFFPTAPVHLSPCAVFLREENIPVNHFFLARPDLHGRGIDCRHDRPPDALILVCFDPCTQRVFGFTRKQPVCVHTVRCIAGRDRAKLCQRVLQLRLVSRLVLSVGLDHDQSARLPLALDRNAAEIPDLINQRQRIPDDPPVPVRAPALVRALVPVPGRGPASGNRPLPYPPAAGWAAAPRFRCRCTRPAAPQDRTERLSGRGACENPVVPSSHTASLLENASKCVVFIAPGFGEFVNRFPHFRVQSFSCDFVKIAGCVPSAG